MRINFRKLKEIDYKEITIKFLKKLVPSICRFIATIAIAALVAIISVIIYNSPPHLYSFSQISFSSNTFDPRTLDTMDYNFTYNVLMDTHCHSTYSDGNLTPEQLIKWHIMNGYNAMVVTDHNTVEGSLVAREIARRDEYKDKIKVLTGMEWTNCRCHLNLIGINVTLEPIKWPTDLEIQQVINKTHELGGVVVYNHRPWSTWAALDLPTIQQFLDWGVDYLDVVNTYYFDAQLYLYSRQNNIPIVAANDFHGGTSALGWTVMQIPNTTYNASLPISSSYFTEDQLLETFKQRNTSLIYSILGSGYDISQQTKPNPKYQRLSPWIKVGDFFHSFYVLHRGTYSFVDGGCGSNTVTIESEEIKATVMWFIVLFILGELTRATVSFTYKRFKAWRNRKQLLKKESKDMYMKDWDSEFGVAGTPLLNMHL